MRCSIGKKANTFTSATQRDKEGKKGKGLLCHVLHTSSSFRRISEFTFTHALAALTLSRCLHAIVHDCEMKPLMVNNPLTRYLTGKILLTGLWRRDPPWLAATVSYHNRTRDRIPGKPAARASLYGLGTFDTIWSP